MAQHILFHVWAATKQDFEDAMVEYGLAEMIDDPDNPGGPQIIQHDRDLRGWDEPGPMVLPDKDSPRAVDPETGKLTGPYTVQLPGFFYNLLAVYRPARNGKLSLAERLEIKELDKDGNPVKYEKYDLTRPIPGQPGSFELLPAHKRTQLHDRALEKSGREVETAGIAGNPKFPRHLEVRVKGKPVFRVLNSEDINTPHNVFA